MSTTSEVAIALRLPSHLRDALRAEANRHQRTMSGQVRWLIERSLHEQEGTAAGAVEDLRKTATAA